MELLREISQELKSSYIDYAMSVIVGRALPDVRDGLKPVQRRILYAMYEMGITSTKPYRKCARIVGDVLGKYHPHGDAAVYDALVRMAQDFAMRYPLIDGQGNFGSIDGDMPAAMRYTEARLAKIAEEMLSDIDKDTVDFVPNFDATLKEPSVLPAKIPNLLINGCSGIAVGMATNMPPHNLREVCDAIIAYLQNPDITVRELMKYVKAPDFPTGGVIVGRKGLIDAYETGKGKITVRGRVEIENNTIIIREIPYMVNKARLVEKIAELINSGKLEAKTVRDESDREGIRIVVEVREDINTALKKLYAYTNLQTTFGIINLALVDNEPRILSLKELIECYVEHRRVVVRRRTQYELKKAKERLHIVEGLKKAIEDIDNVIQLIKSSSSPSEAKTALMERYELSEVQADAILQTRLQKLTAMEIDALMKEYEELIQKIKEYEEILASPQRIDAIIASELEEIKEKYGDERRTEIVEEDGEISAEELVSFEENILIVTKNGFVKRMSIGFKTQHRGGVGVIGIGMRGDDEPAIIVKCNSRDKLLVFTASKAYWLNAYEIPKQERTGKGVNIRMYLSIPEGERIVAIVPFQNFEGDILILTEDGYIKRTPLSEFENAKRAGIVASGGKIAFARHLDGKEVFIATTNGYAVRFKAEDVPEYGRSAKGVKAISLRQGDSIAWLSCIRGDGDILTLTADGHGKRTAVEEYRLVSRGAMGVINARSGGVVFSEYVEGDEDLLTISKDGYALKIEVKSIPRQGRNARGVIVSRKGIACATLLQKE
ncbi:DNA gyrase subunit A [Archaeoglobus veneficus]|uniref:DNA topoisomerase (ATP-hydrolyzing) n=1 Tax=Archaeoglobus veneficus (strain DSM 11195 / SNP6) TaxID=693661 RepID=F2KND5_ARCVS|nr:DNA gyrase subunit A [Archaeoglobus veneficus]AEA47337.1 DNA gyrase, A subunit [Archaeoglobus veneficus SNP6]